MNFYMRLLFMIILASLLSACSESSNQATDYNKWYQYKGTLHTATQAQWNIGNDKDKLASAADLFSIMARRLKPEMLDRIAPEDFDKVMFIYANKMQQCISQTFKKGNITLKASEVSALCFTILYQK